MNRNNPQHAFSRSDVRKEMRRKRDIQIAQNVGLVILSLLLVILTALTWLDEVQLENLENQYSIFGIELNYTSGGFEMRADEVPAAYPTTIAIATTSGVVGAQYNDASILTAYKAVQAQVEASLENIDGFVEADVTAYQQALTGECIYMNYEATLPFSLVASWMGAENAPNANVLDGTHDLAIRALLCTADGIVWARDASGGYYRANTLAFATTWTDSLEALSLEACEFAIAYNPSTELAPDTLIFNTATQQPVVVEQSLTILQSLTDPTLQNVLQTFSYDAYVRSYTDSASDTKVFVESNSTLRISDAGDVRFRASSVEGGVAAYGENEVTGDQALEILTSTARIMMENALRTLDTAAGYRLQYASYDAETDTTKLTFSYMVNGIPLPESVGIAGQFEFRGNNLLAADIYLRSYVISEQWVTLMPMAQIAQMAEQGQEVCISYVQQQIEVVQADAATQDEDADATQAPDDTETITTTQEILYPLRCFVTY